MALHDTAQMVPVRSASLQAPKLFGFRGVTNGSGDITMAVGSDRSGAFTTPSRSTNTYTITIGSFRSLISCNVSTGSNIGVTSITENAVAGTIVIVFAATVASTNISVIALVD